MKLVNLVLALLVSLLIGLLVLEGGLRLIGMGPPTTLNTFDPHTGWTNKPGVSLSTGTPDGERVHFSFNEHGLREADDVTPEARPQRRIVALGDSFTLGRYVEREDLFLDRLEARHGGDVQVVNTGHEGWSTDQEVAWLLEHGDEWKPEVVLLLPYENDLYWCGQTEYTGYDKPRFTPAGELEDRELEDRMEKGWLAGTAIGHLLLRRRPEIPRFQPGSKPGIPREFGVILDEQPEFMADPLARAGGALKALAAECDRLGAELVVVPIPAETAIHAAERERFEKELGLAGVAWSGDNAVERFRDSALAAGVPDERILDVRPRFRAADEAGEVLYFDVDWHLNPRGNEVLADFLAEELARLGLAPEADEPTEPVARASASVPGFLPWYLGLWLLLGGGYAFVYRKVERPALGFLKVGLLLAVIFGIALGGMWLIGWLPPFWSQVALVTVVLVILGFVAYKLGDRLGTIAELLVAFIGRGHWYLMPLVVVLLTVGSLLVVAASSPLVAPFIYTLF